MTSLEQQNLQQDKKLSLSKISQEKEKTIGHLPLTIEWFLHWLLCGGASSVVVGSYTSTTPDDFCFLGCGTT